MNTAVAVIDIAGKRANAYIRKRQRAWSQIKATAASAWQSGVPWWALDDTGSSRTGWLGLVQKQRSPLAGASFRCLLSSDFRGHLKAGDHHMKTQAPELLVSSTVNLTGEAEGATGEGHGFDEDIDVEQ